MTPRRGGAIDVLAMTLPLSLWAASSGAQAPVTREDAVASALSQGARIGLARADTALAFAQLLTARSRPNPTLAGSYSKATPNYHVTLELPIDLPTQRGARIGSARASRAASPLQVAAAEASLEAARLAVRLQRRSIFSTPTIIGGIETGDPTGSEPGILPTFGVGLPLPLLNRNRGPIAQAEAEQARARAALTLAQVQSRTEIARTRRE